MAKQSKRRTKRTNRPKSADVCRTGNVPPATNYDAAISSQKGKPSVTMAVRRELVHDYKKHTATFKDGLKQFCGSDFFFKDNVAAIERAVDFLCEENSNDTIVEMLVPSLRCAIRGREKVAETYTYDPSGGHQYFLDCLKSQCSKLERVASRIPKQELLPTNYAKREAHYDSTCTLTCDSTDSDCLPNMNRYLMFNQTTTETTSAKTGGGGSQSRSLHQLFEAIHIRIQRRSLPNHTLNDIVNLALALGDVELVLSLFDSLQAYPISSPCLELMRSACTWGRLDIIDALVQQRGCPVEGSCYDGILPIYVAAIFHHTAVVQYLVERCGADVNATCGITEKSGIIFVDTPDYQLRKKPMLCLMAESGSLQMTKLLLQLGADVNICCSVGGTPLHYAAAQEHIGVVRTLVEAGGDVNAKMNTKVGENETPLHTAAVWGRTEIATCLLEHGADVNSRQSDEQQSMPIHSACEEGHTEVIKLLVNFGGCNIDAPDAFMSTPLMLAITLKHSSLARTLIEMGANINASNRIGPVIHKALRTKQYDLVTLLINHGADVNSREESDAETPLHSLCRYDDSPVSVMKLLVDHGANVNARMIPSGATPLHWALHYKNPGLVEALIRQGADMFCEASNGIAPDAMTCEYLRETRDWMTTYLSVIMNADDDVRFRGFYHFRKSFELKEIYSASFGFFLGATRVGATKIVGVLIDEGFPINALLNTEHDTPLHIATGFGAYKIARVLLNKGANVDSRDVNGLTPLHQASQQDQSAIISLLSSAGADVNATSNEGASPLFYAANLGKIASIEVLIDCGANVNQTRMPQFTALHAASRNGSLPIVQHLLGHGASVRIHSYEGYSALLYASEAGHTDIVYQLVGRGANINEKHPDGRSVLHVAIMQDHLEIVRLLLQLGADVDIACRGRTALHCACEFNRVEILDCLLAHGANHHILGPKDTNALHLACNFGHLEIVKTLIERNLFDINAKAMHGATPLDLVPEDALELRAFLIEHRTTRPRSSWFVPASMCALIAAIIGFTVEHSCSSCAFSGW